MKFNLLNLIIIVGLVCFVYAAQKNPYQILQINENATEEQIKTKFRELTKKYHPDKNKDPKAAEYYQEITNAYTTLTNPDAKRKYEDEVDRTRQRSNSYYYNVYDNYENKQSQYRKKWHEAYQKQHSKSYQYVYNEKKAKHKPSGDSGAFGLIGKVISYIKSFSLKEILVYGVAIYIIVMIFKGLTIQVGQV